APEFEAFEWLPDGTVRARCHPFGDPSRLVYLPAEVGEEVLREPTCHERGLMRRTARCLGREESRDADIPVPHVSSSDLEPSPGIVFELLPGGDAYAVVDYEGDSPNLVIPAEHDGLPVTTVGKIQRPIYRVVQGRHIIRRVIIPDSVTRISSWAFSGLRDLVSVTIGRNVATIGDMAFLHCYQLVEIYNRSDLVLQKGSSEYGGIALYAKDIYAEGGYKTKIRVDRNDFLLYESEGRVTMLGHEDSDLDLWIPEGVHEINDFALADRSQYISVRIPASVTRIGGYSFSGCYRLTEVFDFTHLGIEAGSEDNGWVALYAKAVHRDADEPSVLERDEGGFLTYVHEGRRHLVDYHGDEETVSIPAGIVEVDDEAFFLCGSREVQLCESLGKVSVRAWEHAESLERLVVPSEVSRLNASLFRSGSLLGNAAKRIGLRFAEPTGWMTSTGDAIPEEKLADEKQALEYLRGISDGCEWIARVKEE
ncbi:MAG: leucine-rich repeat protein, partial [Bacilli bacterium]|nr:leucine-rich repeat protein [Bacilli bacterium]